MIRSLGNLAKSNLLSGLAAILLAYQGILPEKDRSGWIIGLALVVGVLDAVAGYVLIRREQTQLRVEGLARDHLGDVTMALATLATDRPQDWAAELLVCRPRHWFRDRRTDVVLRRVAFHRLGSGLVLPAALQERERSPATHCLRGGLDVLWSTVPLPNGSPNYADDCEQSANAELAAVVGACRCTLVMDRNEGTVLGVLAIYFVADTPELIVGTMEQVTFAEIQRRAARTLGRAMTDG